MKYFKSFFWNVSFFFTCCFNGDSRNWGRSFGWTCKPLVPFWRDYSISDNYDGCNQTGTVR